MIKACEALLDVVRNGDVHHAFKAHGVVIADAGGYPGIKLFRRLGGDHVDNARRRVAAIQRSLRAAQNFDTFEVEVFRVTCQRLVYVDTVDMEAKARFCGAGNGVVADSAHGDAQGIRQQVGNAELQIRHLFDEALVEGVTTESRQ